MKTNIKNINNILEEKNNFLNNFFKSSENENGEMILEFKEKNNISKLSELDSSFLEENFTKQKTNPDYVTLEEAINEISLWISQKRINQILSRLEVKPAFLINSERINLADPFEKELAKLIYSKFEETTELYNFQDVLRLGISSISLSGKGVFLFRKNISDDENEESNYGLSFSDNFLYIYDDFGKLIYLFVVYQRTRGIVNYITTEEYVLETNSLTTTMYSKDGKYKKISNKLDDVQGENKNSIPAVILFNPFSNYKSDLSIITEEIKDYAKLKTITQRNLSFSIPSKINEIDGEFTTYFEDDEEDFKRVTQGYDDSSSSFFSTGENRSSKWKYNYSNLQPSADSIILKERIKNSILAKIDHTSEAFLEKSAQINEDLIEYTDKNIRDSYIQGLSYYKSKLSQLYNLMSVSVLDGQKIYVDFKFDTYSKKIVVKSQAMLEVSQNLKSLENYVFEFSEGTIEEKIDEIHFLLNKKIDENNPEIVKSNNFISSNNKNPLQNEKIKGYLNE